MKHLGDGEWMGFFSLPENRGQEVHGLLRVRDHKPVLVVSGELAPWSQDHVSVIHGRLMGAPHLVTLFEAGTIRESTSNLVDENNVPLVEQTYRVSWLVYGALLTDEDRVTHAFVHLSGLDAWAQAPIASLESTSDQAEERQGFDNLVAPVVGPLPGTVRLTFPGERRFEAHHKSLVRRTQLEWTGREPMPLQEVTQCFAVHLQEFFSLLRMNRAVVDRYRVRIAEGPERPLEVDGWMVEDPLDDQRHDGMAARRGESGVELIAAWLERRPELGRAPELTSNVLARGKYGERFVDADFSTMVMSLEGLHRKLHSGKTGALTKAQARKARRAIGDIIARAKGEGEIDDLIASTLKNRVLNSQLGEPTLDERIQDILDDVQPLVPIICGTAAGAQDLWKREVKSLRNNYAHGLEKQTQLRKNLVLSTSLTVLVASRCLVYVGCSPEKLVESIPLTEGGGNLVHWGRTLMPDFYAPNDVTLPGEQIMPSDEDAPGAED